MSPPTTTIRPVRRPRSRAVLLVRHSYPVDVQLVAAIDHLRVCRHPFNAITRTTAGALAFLAGGGADVVLAMRLRGGPDLDELVAAVGARVEYLPVPARLHITYVHPVGGAR